MKIKELKELLADLDEMYQNTTFYNDNDRGAFWELYKKYNNIFTEKVLKKTEKEGCEK